MRTELPEVAFHHDGAQRFPSALNAAALQSLKNALVDLPPAHAGIRLHGIASLKPFLTRWGR